MLIITEAAIAAAADQAEAADRDLAAAEAPLVRSGRRIDQETAARLAVLQIQARHTRANVDELTAGRADQQRALHARAQREEKASPAIAQAQRDLEASRARLVAAVSAGDLTAAGKAALAHDALVVATRAMLTRAGLLLSDVAEDCDHATGADAGPTGSGLRLRGQFWDRVDAGAVLAWMAHRTAVSLLGRTVADRLVHAGAVHAGRRPDGLLATVPDLPAHVEPARWRPPSIPRDVPTAGSGLTYLERAARDRRPEPDPHWRERWAREHPGVPVPGGDAA